MGIGKARFLEVFYESSTAKNLKFSLNFIKFCHCLKFLRLGCPKHLTGYIHSPLCNRSILKIQENMSSQLIIEEEGAVKFLKAKSTCAADAFHKNSTSLMDKSLAKRRRMNERPIQYAVKKFLLGSAADVVRHFCIAIKLFRKIVHNDIVVARSTAFVMNLRTHLE